MPQHPSLTHAQAKLARSLDHLRQELRGIRSGRVTPALIEQVKVEAYDTLTPLVELASITAPEPRLIVVSAWDKSLVRAIDKALQAADVGANPTLDGAVIRLNFPPLSEERRRDYVKLMHVKLEEARVAMRGVREEALKTFKVDRTSGTLAEDQFFSLQKELQKLVDQHGETIAELGREKEIEIMAV